MILYDGLCKFVTPKFLERVICEVFVYFIGFWLDFGKIRCFFSQVQIGEFKCDVCCKGKKHRVGGKLIGRNGLEERETFDNILIDLSVGE